MSVPALRDAVEGWLHPVPGGAPTGVDARYLPRAEALRAEVGKLDAPTGGAVDWARVLKDAERLTRETTKDVLVLAYAAVALAELRGLAGLAEGCLLVAEGCDRFWDGMYPPASRPRARIRALEWLAARATASVENAAVTAPDRPTVAALAAAVARLREVSRARLGDRAPSLRAVEEGVERLRLALPSPPDRSPPPAALAAGPAQPRAAPAGAGAGSKGGPDRPPAAGRQVAPDQAPDPGSPGEAPGLGAGASPPLGPSGTPGTTVQPSELRRLTGPILERCLEAASTLRLAAPGDPAAYRIARMALALDTGRAPPATSGTRTAVPAPSASQVRELEAWAARGDFASLLDAAEGALRSHRFWLDLHRYAAIALAGLGVDYRAARAEVLSGCAYLAVRYPELLELTFRDGLPFASEATRAWIEAEVLPGAARRGAAAEPSPGLGRDGDLAAARRALVSGDRDHALRLLAELTRAAEGGRSRFRARLELARALATGSTVDAAEGLLEGLGRRIDQLGLEAWEPELAAEVYRVHLVCLSRSARPADPDLARRRSAVRRRLCGVEPMTTLAATPRGR